MADEVSMPTPAQRRQVYAEGAILMQRLLAEMTALHVSTERVMTYAAEARRQGIIVPIDGCLDAMLTARLMQCQKVVKRLARLAQVGS